MASLQPHLKVLEKFQLTPPPGSPATQSSLPFNFYDLVWIHAGPVEKIFFYSLPCSTSHFISTILPDLKSSLSRALDVFYPLYGKIRRSVGNVSKYELRYVDGDSVSFIVAQLDNEDFADLSGNHARDAKRLLSLVPELHVDSGDGAKHVLAIQVSLFPNQGITIGITIHHAACDGHTSTKFLSTWTSIFKGSSSSFSPVFDRTVISDPHDIYSSYLREYGTFTRPWGTAPPTDILSRTFTLTSAQIQRLKDAIQERANGEGHTAYRFSTTVVIYALVWVCVVRARKYASDRIVHFLFAVNCSHGHQPPIPPEFFGNRIGALFFQTTAGELYKDEGLVVVAKDISKAIGEFRENALIGVEKVIEKLLAVVPQQVLSVAGSPQLRIYDIDFGWGKPKKIELTSIMNGAMSLTESGDGQGGVEMGFILPEEVMDEFAAQFSNVVGMLSLENDG